MKTKIFIPLAGLALFCACKGRGGYEVANADSDADLDTTKKELYTLKKDTLSVDQKLVKTAAIQFKVKSVNQTEQKLSALTHRMGGLVTHQQIRSSVIASKDARVGRDSVMRVTSLSTSAELTVKVPTVNLEQFTDSVSAMGMYVTDRSFDITDKTYDYLSAKLKLKSRQDLINRQKNGKVIIKDPTKVMNLADDMIDQQIENRQINDDVKNSVVNLAFFQSNTINNEVIVNDDPSAYDQPFFSRLATACQSGWSLFINVLIGLANVWFLLVIGGLIWLYIIRYKKRKKASYQA